MGKLVSLFTTLKVKIYEYLLIILTIIFLIYKYHFLPLETLYFENKKLQTKLIETEKLIQELKEELNNCNNNNNILNLNSSLQNEECLIYLEERNENDKIKQEHRPEENNNSFLVF